MFILGNGNLEEVIIQQNGQTALVKKLKVIFLYIFFML